MREQLKADIKDSLYLMLSTFNQMVNYIPYKYFAFSHIWNITIEDKRNEAWDDNFKKMNGVTITKTIGFEKTEVLKIDDLKRRLRDKLLGTSKDKIFWNITGGQRPFVMAIYDLIGKSHIEPDFLFLNNKTHYLCYLEGNSGEMKIMKYQNGKIDDDVSKSYAYSVDGLIIEDALRLMGFKITEPIINLLDHFDEQKKTFCNKFLDILEEDREGSLRKILTKFNINTTNEDKDNRERLDNYKATIAKVSECTKFTSEELDAHWMDFKLKKAFGFILEDLTTYKILDVLHRNPVLKSKVAALYASTKINFKYTDSRSPIDEFDILLLTKTGQLINFECKSGDMSGDNAKSNKYSTYVVAGVYGLPVLISPLLKHEKSDSIFFNKSVKAATLSADRAQLDIWCIDDIEEKLKARLT